MSEPPANRSFLLTPPGTGAIGVVRVVGPDAIDIVQALIYKKGRPQTPADPLRRGALGEAGRTIRPLRYGVFMDGDESIDDVVVSLAPSATDSAVDICVHGGIRVIERILSTLEGRGVPLGSAPDIETSIWTADGAVEVEADEALAYAKTGRAVRFLAYQRTHLAQRIREAARVVSTSPLKAQTLLQDMSVNYRAARILLEGAVVALVGPVNSGKSTLFNRLVGRKATIESPRAGTTRDWVSAEIEVEGIPITLIDTAGRRDSSETLESVAQRQGRSVASRATVTVLVLDESQPLDKMAARMLADQKSSRARLVVVNKADLATGLAVPATRLGGDKLNRAIRLSALTGRGIGRLGSELSGVMGVDGSITETPSLFTLRQMDLVREGLAMLPDDPKAAGGAILGLLNDR